MRTNNLFSFRHLLLTLLVVAQYGLQAQAVISCIGGTGNVSTGISNSPGNPYLGISTPDPNWKITSSPSGALPAIVCPSFLPFWCPTPIALTNAGWINATSSFSGHRPGNYVFERQFIVPTGPGILDLNFGIAFDDTLVSLSLVPPTGSPIPLTVVSNPPPNNYCIGSFPTPRNIQCPVAGTWKIRAEITYIDNVGGFMLSGNIRCQDAACPPVPCKAEITNIVCGPIVNGQQTYLVSGTINNSSTSAATLGITVAPGGGTVSSISPATIPATPTGNSFTFTYTPPFGPPVSPCFNITLSSGVSPKVVVLCESRICRELPICCKAEITKVECGPLVNGQQTYIVSGTINNSSTSAATLDITVGGGSVSSISPATVPASSTGNSFSFTYTAPSGPPVSPCFNITLSSGVRPRIVLCESRICRDLPICCKAEITKVECGPLLPTGQQTYLISGTITNGSTSAATLGITVASGGGVVSSVSPATIPASSTATFSFTYTAGTLAPCFDITLSGGTPSRILCQSRICRELPICPCKAEITKVECGPLLPTGQQTYLISGTITNGSTSAATLGIIAPGGGVVSSVLPATVPASSTAPFSFTYTAGTGTLAPCFDITLSGGTPSRILCQSRICRELPICPDNCCPVVKVVYSTCHPLPIKHGTFTVSGPKCLSSMTITWTAPALSPTGVITYNDPTLVSAPWSGPGTFTYSSFGSTNVTNLQFGLSSALAATGTVTVSFVLCDGTKCTQTFPWTSKSTGNPIELAQTKAETGKIFLASFNLKSGAVDGKRPKFVAFGFSNRDEITTFKPVILAVTGARHPADPYDQKIMSLEKASNSALNAVFELDETTPYTDRLLNVVYRADKPDLQLAYVIYDAEGNPLGTSGIKLAAALVTTDTKEVRVAPNEQMMLFPNPADHYLQVNYITDASHPVLLEVFDLLGRSAGIVQRSQAGKGENQYTLDTANLPGGSYVLKISSNNGVLTQAFQIVR